MVDDVKKLFVGEGEAPKKPPTHRPSSEKMCYLIFPGKGRSAYTLAPPPLSGHPSPPYENRSASFFASYDLNLM